MDGSCVQRQPGLKAQRWRPRLVEAMKPYGLSRITFFCKLIQLKTNQRDNSEDNCFIKHLGTDCNFWKSPVTPRQRSTTNLTTWELVIFGAGAEALRNMRGRSRNHCVFDILALEEKLQGAVVKWFQDLRYRKGPGNPKRDTSWEPPKG